MVCYGEYEVCDDYDDRLSSILWTLDFHVVHCRHFQVLAEEERERRDLEETFETWKDLGGSN